MEIKLHGGFRAPLVCSLIAVLVGCAAGPHLHGQVTLRLMADRDFAHILLAHFDAGIELASVIASLKVGNEVAALVGTFRRNEETDRAALAAWVATQQAQPSAVGQTHVAESQASHATVLEQLRARSGEGLDDHVLRLLVSHHNEGLTFIRQTPVQDDDLQRIVDAVRHRLSEQMKLLARRLPSEMLVKSRPSRSLGPRGPIRGGDPTTQVSPRS